MSRYRVAYADPAAVGRNALPADARKRFDAGIAALARDPYGCRSSSVKGSRDRRDAAIGGVALIRYEVSSGVLIVTVLRVVGL
ncbi:hypothetical protein [Streptomyces sp. NBC_00690]|uniref:hypothetical protein n=1 Tax=Streptomyces sp. NBC_00690 TaxID=2975808 RepID=UPI002E2ADB59|nr:hypothetical protein [Streptomyces sp. NBC_00690]